MNEQELAELQKACDSATPGPWYVVEMDDDVCMSAYAVATVPHADAPPNEDSERNGDHNKRIALTLWQDPRIVDIEDAKWVHNANFICAARNALPTLLERETKSRKLFRACLRALNPHSVSERNRLSVQLTDAILEHLGESAPAAKGCKEGGSET
jgi:hypothetical protein